MVFYQRGSAYWLAERCNVQDVHEAITHSSTRCDMDAATGYFNRRKGMDGQ